MSYGPRPYRPYAMPLADRAHLFVEPLAVRLAHVMVVRVGGAIPPREVREFLLDEGQVPGARRGAKTKRARVYVRRPALADRLHQPVEIRWIVRDRGKHRHHVDPRFDARLAQSRQCAKPRFRRRRAWLDATRELAVERDQ